MLGHEYRIAYETPVFGPPWTMPYEFPLHEWSVAGVLRVLRARGLIATPVFANDKNTLYRLRLDTEP